ncbi:MAG: Holliday junction branch migration protein RuvA [Deltaproteobacteria bacterium]|nr:Holliday junction branch migration protein RuvA [Deltaproteobacteria bacterium]
MIGYISGQILGYHNDLILVSAGAFAFEVYYKPKKKSVTVGSEIALYSHLSISESEQQFYGFETEIEKEIFKILIKIPGVGSKTSYAIVSQLAIEELISAIHNGNSATFAKVKGVGQRTADKITFELKNFLSKRVSDLCSRFSVSEEQGDEISFAVAALEKLGISRSQAQNLVMRSKTKLEETGIQVTVDRLVSEGLRVASSTLEKSVS